MKKINRITMANENIVSILLGNELIIKQDKNNYYSVYEDNQYLNDYFASFKEAEEWAKNYATQDGDIRIKGWGRYSGLEFWRLPDNIKNKILEFAGF